MRRTAIFPDMIDGRPQTGTEELANALTHGSGLAASLVGLPPLLLLAESGGDARRFLAACIFAATLVLLYAASTLYHAVPASSPRTKELLRVIDHVSIFLLIAGTYTPFTLGVLRGAWGWSLFGIVWGLAVVGILYKTVFRFRFPRLSVFLYLLMGWLAIVAVGPLARALPPAALGWLLAGGLFYTVGVRFYLQDSLRYRHALWHLFVLAGSICHYTAVLRYATSSIR